MDLYVDQLRAIGCKVTPFRVCLIIRQPGPPGARESGGQSNADFRLIHRPRRWSATLADPSIQQTQPYVAGASSVPGMCVGNVSA